ncbi:MAG: hypothetical protein HQL76_10130 [Magnetococcales bacterium]|nr:hypothetical protein [Magnetococcales bacterium]
MLEKLRFTHHLQILFFAVALPVLAVLTIALMAAEEWTDTLNRLGGLDLPLSRIIGVAAREHLGQGIEFNKVLLNARIGNREKFELANDSFIQYGKRIGDTLLEGRNITQRRLEREGDPERMRAVDAIKTTLKEIEKLHGDFEHLAATLIRGIYQYEFLMKPELMKNGDHVAIEEEEARQVASLAKSLSAMEDETNRLENKIKDGIEQIEGLSQTLVADTASARISFYKILVSIIFSLLAVLFFLGILIERIHERRALARETEYRTLSGQVEETIRGVLPTIRRMEQMVQVVHDQKRQQSGWIVGMGKHLNAIQRMIEDNIATARGFQEQLNHREGLLRQAEKKITVLDREAREALIASRETVKVIRSLKNRLMQINMLTTHASAEAFRNEATRGFSVFTDDIREHAQKSAEEAELVAELLEHHQGKVGNDTETVKEIRGRIDELIDLGLRGGQTIVELRQPNEQQLPRVEELHSSLDVFDKKIVEEKGILEECLRSTSHWTGSMESLLKATDPWSGSTSGAAAPVPATQ